MSSENNDLIKFQAIVSKVQTMSDGGLRVILDMPETEINTATKMMQAKRLGAVLEVVAIPIDNSIENILKADKVA